MKRGRFIVAPKQRHKNNKRPRKKKKYKNKEDLKKQKILEKMKQIEFYLFLTVLAIMILSMILAATIK